MLAITPGEPAGIGPDLVIQLVQQGFTQPIVVIADASMLSERAALLGCELNLRQYPEPALGPGELSVLDVPLSQTVQPGVLDVRNGPGLMRSLERAVDGCLSGTFTGLVTGPVQKSVLIDAGYEFSGHTEFLCQRSGVDDVVMLLVAQNLRVALATTHLPLNAVSEAITQELLTRRLEILHAELCRKFDIAQPEIIVCGLNPHAGEQGHLGVEEIEIINPVIEALRGRGMHLVGPLPADTAFTPRHLRSADAVMAMFHDQGLPVLKYAGFGEGVNVTLGLPFVRTSVDHGTALDLAGSGEADLGSLVSAIELAGTLKPASGVQ
ncbi:MAG: 4-hydroxythreonine-4-phosphate dehydrogenase PdxA [Pseudomonadota bacterium]